MNKEFGPHPYLFDFVWHLAVWFVDGFVAYNQYKLHGPGNDRHETEILKERVLLKWWDFIDEHQTEKDVLLFLEQTSKALKAGHKALKKML